MAVHVERLDSGVLCVTLQRPDQRNALNFELLGGMNRGVGRELRAGGVRAIVVRGAGGYFSAGADLKEMHEARTAGPEGRRRLELAMAELIYTMTNFATLRIPTIALVEGGASGGGVGLLASCQIVLVKEGAIFRLPETQIGLFPFMISPVLIRRMGFRSFLEMTLSGKRVLASEALELGLVDELVRELPDPSSLVERSARPWAVWPSRDGSDEVDAAVASYSSAPKHLLQAAAKAALMQRSMALPIAMRTGAIELQALVSKMGEM